MIETKEFEDVIISFEQWARHNLRTGGMGLNREARVSWKQQVYYSDGFANEAFKAFLVGYSLGKSVSI